MDNDPLLSQAKLIIDESRRLRTHRSALIEDLRRRLDELRLARLESEGVRHEIKALREEGKFRRAASGLFPRSSTRAITPCGT
jgi:hypothetical protein